MKIVSCKFEFTDGFSFSKVDLQQVNLLVGLTGSGKTRFLNALFNMAIFATQVEDAQRIYCFPGKVEVCLETENYFFEWEYECSTERLLTKEKILRTNKSTTLCEILVEREVNTFKFKKPGSKKLTDAYKSPPSTSSIYLLQREELIKPLYDEFFKIIRRDFAGDSLSKAKNYSPIPEDLVRVFENDISRGLYTSFNEIFNLNVRLYLIQKYFPGKYNEIIKTYKEIFPTITNCQISDTTKTKIATLLDNIVAPVFLISETGISKPISLHNLSSGMLKVLLIIVDIVTMPEGGIYLLDEYENSLGVNALDPLLGLVQKNFIHKQLIMTSHHPYIISHIPVLDWYIFNRKGSKVAIKYGQELIKQYGPSSRDAFLELINDSFFDPDKK